VGGEAMQGARTQDCCARCARCARGAFTVVEMLVVIVMFSITLTILFTIFSQLLFRVQAVQMRAEGQQAVRLLLLRMRHELKRASTIVQIEKSNQLLRIPLQDPTRRPEDTEYDYFREYEYLPDRKEIVVRKLNRDKKLVDEQLWLGGRNQIWKFKCYDTGENERILFQYYRVIIEVDHYEVTMSEVMKRTAAADQKTRVVHLTTTVYPRRVNMELRIEVPQEGGSGI
jgi:type II secretory pathway pseudopilin PulG